MKPFHPVMGPFYLREPSPVGEGREFGRGGGSGMVCAGSAFRMSVCNLHLVNRIRSEYYLFQLS